MSKKKTIKVITGERGQGMTYSTLALAFDVPLGSRDWYKKIHEDLLKEVEDAKTRD